MVSSERWLATAALLSTCALMWVAAKPAVAVDALTDIPGDAARGRDVVLDRERGHCVLCHRIAQLSAPFQGNVGPELSAVGDRLDAAAIRQRVIDPTTINPDSAMPAYYRTDGLVQVAPEYRDRPVLTAQEIEDVVAFLQTLMVQRSDQ